MSKNRKSLGYNRNDPWDLWNQITKGGSDTGWEANKVHFCKQEAYIVLPRVPCSVEAILQIFTGRLAQLMPASRWRCHDPPNILRNAYFSCLWARPVFSIEPIKPSSSYSVQHTRQYPHDEQDDTRYTMDQASLNLPTALRATRDKLRALLLQTASLTLCATFSSTTARPHPDTQFLHGKHPWSPRSSRVEASLETLYRKVEPRFLHGTLVKRLWSVFSSGIAAPGLTAMGLSFKRAVEDFKHQESSLDTKSKTSIYLLKNSQTSASSIAGTLWKPERLVGALTSLHFRLFRDSELGSARSTVARRDAEREGQGKDERTSFCGAAGGAHALGIGMKLLLYFMNYITTRYLPIPSI
ncbi:hypothetical protein K438DRAFT_1764364 [Mycena galopus ATCC 62051]|nr:hypothetical protein K438DRAFT_1764364 [Mycena galopus ATCC 62051]